MKGQRRLKIEATGDFWRRRVKPKIRLTGNWLARAGFRPGDYIEVVPLADGVMELRVVGGGVRGVVGPVPMAPARG